MPKTDVKILAALAEIVASVAVVVSLIFVVISVRQNTSALQSLNDNFIFEIQDAWFADTSSDSELVQIIVKYDSGESITAVEQYRLKFWVSRELNLWELAFNRYHDGLMRFDHWAAWDKSFSLNVFPYVSEEQWEEVKIYYGVDFGNHVEAAYSNQ